MHARPLPRESSHRAIADVARSESEILAGGGPYGALATALHGALQNGDLHTALSTWAKMETRFSSDLAAIGARLRRRSRMDEADEMLKAAIARFPDSADLLAEYAWVAHSRSDWPEALLRWRMVWETFPARMDGPLGVAIALREDRKFDEADAIFEQAIAQFPKSFNLLKEYAWVAHHRRNWAEAHARWRAVSDAFSDRHDGLAGEGIVLREAGALDEADAVLEQALEKFPGHAGLLTERAWVASRRRDWPEAAKRWGAVYTGFPDRQEGYFGLAAALRELREFDRAEAVFANALERFPPSPNLLAEHAWLAHRAKDWPTAIARWRTLKASFRDHTAGYSGLAAALNESGAIDEAEDVLSEAVERFPDRLDLATNYAECANRRRDWPEALKRWGEIKTGFAHDPSGYIGAARALRELRRLDEAEAIAGPGIRLFPDNFELLKLHAALAGGRSDFDEARRRWSQVIALFPDRPDGYIGAANAEFSKFSLAEGEKILADGIARLPDDPNLEMERARVFHRREDWAGASSCWEKILERFPRHPAAAAGLATALGNLGRLEEAESLLAAAVERFPDHPEPLRRYAETAAKRGEWDEGERRWKMFQERLPNDAEGPLALGIMLREAGRGAEAEKVFTEALKRFPYNFELDRQRAILASVRRDWPEAFRQWEVLKRRFPNDSSIRSGIADALWQARQDQGVQALDGGSPIVIPESLLEEGPTAEAERAAFCELFMQFESLGDSCEFGIVQRRYGAEPLSLLRWTNTPPEKLAAALDDEFTGVGDPENLVLDVRKGEYVTTDTRYHMFSHTFTRESAAPRDIFFKQQSRRMQFLRRKLVNDLADGEKIFVYYKTKSPGLNEEEIAALHAAIRRYGKKPLLLCVALERPGKPAGAVDDIGEGLMIGYNSRFSTTDIDIESWISMCRKCLIIVHGNEENLAAN
jgi:tetratricopeptide (TPR) repeat protein